MWNIITFTILQVGLVQCLAGFSADFRHFCWMGVHLPCLLGSVAYYCFKCGFRDCLRSLTFSAMMKWVRNWIGIQGIALCCVSQTMVFYFVAMLLQPYVLPQSWQFSVTIPASMYEEYLKVTVYYFWGLFAVCLGTLPLWKRGYELSMQVVGRKNGNITYPELFMELMYQTVQSGVVHFTLMPIMLALQNSGVRVYCIHFLFAAVEIIFIHSTLQFKFCILHQLIHEVQPLYAMTHMEHHICKGIFPTTASVGVWEMWLMGQMGHITTPFGLGAAPWALLHLFYTSSNVVVHTMWPSQSLLQWHTLHHTVLSDVYNANIPSPYDKEHSKSVAKLEGKLGKVSPFVRYELLSDVVGLVFIGAFALLFHYGIGIGAGRVDWSRVDILWHSTATTANI